MNGPKLSIEKVPAGAAKLQRKCAGPDDRQPVRAPALENANSQSEVQRPPVRGGEAIDQETRSFFEPHFAHDFSRVRIHADALAADSAREVHACAYTVGNDVVFGAGQYAPETHAGRKLLAHELAHVVQQSPASDAAPSGTLPVSQPGDAAERQAEAAADAIMEPGPAGVQSVGGVGGLSSTAGRCLQRQPDNKAAEPAKKKVEQGAKDAVAQARQKIQDEGAYQLRRRHVPTVPQPRGVAGASKPRRPFLMPRQRT